MLAADVSLHADGGGQRPAIGHPVFGFDEVMRVHEQLSKYFLKNGSTLSARLSSTGCRASLRANPTANCRRRR
jgi:hypothetical protein